MIELLNITDEAMRNYNILWQTYNENKKDFTLMCIHTKKRNCSLDPLAFHFVDRDIVMKEANDVRKNQSLGILIEGEVIAPPCTDPTTVKKFKIDPICDFLKNVSHNKEAFLKLMIFTKQSPVILEEDDEYYSVFSNVDSCKFGHSLKKNIKV